MNPRKSHFDMLQWLPETVGAALIAAAKRRCVPAGGSIYVQEEEGDEMFRLVSGSVRLSVMGADGRELLYLLFAPGDCFGTSSLVDGETRPHTAEAFETIELQVLDRATINRLRRDYPEVNDALLRLLSRHMRVLSDYFAGATFDEAPYRLAERLVEIAMNFGVESGEGIKLNTRFSQSQLAAMVGTSRQTVNRFLQMFQVRDWISMRGAGITITNLAALQTMAKNGARLRTFAD